MNKKIHYVKIVDGKVDFDCQDVSAKCHTYPGCDCDIWGDEHAAGRGPGHEMRQHTECWMQGWFDNGGAVYLGDDAEDGADNRIPEGMNREGFITAIWEDEWVEFEFVAVIAPAELTHRKLDDEMQELDEAGQQETDRFKALWAEAEKRGIL